MKPTIQEFGYEETAEGYDINEVMNFLGEKYKIDFYDFYKSSIHFHKWCDIKGYGQTDSTGVGRSSSNIWFAEYQKDSEGKIKCPEYACILDWFIDKYMPDQRINEFNVDKSIFEDELSEPVRTFLKYAFKEFGEDKNEITLVLNFED